MLALVILAVTMGTRAEQQESIHPDKNVIRLFYTVIGIAAVGLLYGWLFPPRARDDGDGGATKEKTTVLPPPDTAPTTTTSLNPFEDAPKTL